MNNLNFIFHSYTSPYFCSDQASLRPQEMEAPPWSDWTGNSCCKSRLYQI